MVTERLENGTWLRSPQSGVELTALPALTTPFQWLVAWPGCEFPRLTATVLEEAAVGWMATADFLQAHQLQPELDNYKIATTLAGQPIAVTTLGQEPALPEPAPQPGTLSLQSRILAIIPHRDCHLWLEAALCSLLQQTRPLDAIVVVDDGSAALPDQICHQYPQVTLLKGPGGVGPYQIVQSLVAATHYDAYLFQDSDDWSAPDRVERLLAAAIEFGAEIVGCQELRVDDLAQQFYPVLYPLDVQKALATAPGHALLHPSSLVSRRAIDAVGGFANGLRFGGDTEFLLRAFQRVRVINIPEFGYFRRKRAHSLTTSIETGLESPQRLALLQTLKTRAQAHQEARRNHQPIDLQPLIRIPTITFKYCCGPKIIGEF